MHSLDFEEFLWSLGYDDTIKEDILSHMQSFTPFSFSVLKLYNDLFLDYCIVGGMPEVVKDFVKKKTFELEPISVEDAKVFLDTIDNNFYIFLNRETNKVNVLYRRLDNNFGLIEVLY